MHPLQLSRERKLFRTQRNGEYDLYVAEVFLRALVGIQTHNFNIPELCRQFLGEP